MEFSTPLSEIMTRTIKSANPNDIFIEIAQLFETHSFHHIPVIDSDHIPVGIVSRHDYNTLKHHFSNMKWAKENTDKHNEKLFESLLVEDVMNNTPICLKEWDPVTRAIDIFLENKIHSLIICNDTGEFKGIVTPHDILKYIKRI